MTQKKYKIREIKGNISGETKYAICVWRKPLFRKEGWYIDKDGGDPPVDLIFSNELNAKKFLEEMTNSYSYKDILIL